MNESYNTSSSSWDTLPYSCVAIPCTGLLKYGNMNRAIASRHTVLVGVKRRVSIARGCRAQLFVRGKLVRLCVGNRVRVYPASSAAAARSRYPALCGDHVRPSIRALESVTKPLSDFHEIQYTNSVHKVVEQARLS